MYSYNVKLILQLTFWFCVIFNAFNSTEISRAVIILMQSTKIFSKFNIKLLAFV